MHLDDASGILHGLGSLIGVELRTGVSHVVETTRDPQFEESASQHVGRVISVNGGNVALAGHFLGDLLQPLQRGDSSIVSNGINSSGHFRPAELGVVGSSSVHAFQDALRIDVDHFVEEGEFRDDFGLPSSLLEGRDDLIGS